MDISSDELISKLTEAQSIEEIAEVALWLLRKLPQPVAMVCGRLRTGGGGFEENRRMIRKAISYVRRHEHEAVFDQLIFLGRSDRLPDARWRLRVPFIRNHVLRRRRRAMREKFHLPLLRSGLIREMFFLPGWELSEGSRWYYDRAIELGIKIHYLQEEDFSAR